MPDNLINRILLVCSNDSGQPVTEEWRRSTTQEYDALSEQDKRFLLGLSPEDLENIIVEPSLYGSAKHGRALSPGVSSFLDSTLGC